jgi:ribosomal protein L35AE/L33A
VTTAIVGVPAAPASAKSAYDSAYGFDRTWNAGLRLVRVDLGLKVTEKDDANGYLLFDYKSPESGQKPVPGSMEFIKGKDGAVRVVVQIAQMPGYHEQVLVDSLQRKLRNEYGDPPKKPPMPSAPKDAGPDSSDTP